MPSPKPKFIQDKEEKNGSVAVAEAPQEVKKAEKSDYTLNIIEDYSGQIDVFHTNKDPQYEYRFLRDEFKNMSMKTGNVLFQKGGWQVCDRKHLVRLGYKGTDISPDGYRRVGDTILAFMPKELFKKKEEAKRKKANAPIDAIKRRYKKGVSSQEMGGDGVHDSFKGFQTASQLGMGSEEDEF